MEFFVVFNDMEKVLNKGKSSFQKKKNQKVNKERVLLLNDVFSK